MNARPTEMDADRQLLVGALALQSGLIDSNQFAESYRHWESLPDQSLLDVLVQHEAISPSDAPHIEYLQQHALEKHHGDVRAALASLTSMVRRSLEVLESLDSEGTIAGSISPQNRETAPGPADEASGPSRYNLMKLYGAGGIGRVWQARDRQIDREVALKELLPENSENSKATARFFREAKLTGQLEHPGVVPVYELGLRPETNQPFYTMRLVQGRTLGQAVAAYHAKRAEGRADPMDFVGLLTAFAAVCNTIAYAHSKGILHRDLKGENVILGDYGEVIVLDWGVAKRIGQPDLSADSIPLDVHVDVTSDPTLTIQGEIVGTPAFMAPEQSLGRLDQIDERTDIYGLGALLYTILTGRSPFVASHIFEMLHKVMEGNPTPPREIHADVPEALESACLKAMAKDKERRFASAGELAQEVQRWQEIQRRQAEDALRRQTEVLRSILDGMSEGIFVADADGGLLLMNPAAERLIGRPSEATLDATRRTSVFFRPDTITPIEDHELPSARAIRGEEVDDEEMFIRPVHSGNEVWISVNARPLRSDDGKVRGGVVAFRDVTERKRAAEALRASEEKYRTLADLIPGIVWTSRPDGWIDYANAFWFKFTGLTMEQTEGAGWAATVHPDDLERVTQVWGEALQSGEPVEVEYRVRRAADGAYRWFLAHGRPMRDGEGRIVKWFGLLTEIEEQKKNRDALERQLGLVRLLQQFTGAAYAAGTVEEAIQFGIDQVCVFTGWPIGHVYFLADDGSNELIPSQIWHLDRPDEFQSFVRVTEATRLASGAGLPGRVLASEKPHWIMDVTLDQNFPRANAAANLGVKGAFAFPVMAGSGVVAVLEFFTSEPKEPDEVLLRAMAQIGLQLGQVFERKKMEESLRASKSTAAR